MKLCEAASAVHVADIQHFDVFYPGLQHALDKSVFVYCEPAAVDNNSINDINHIASLNHYRSIYYRQWLLN
jgi:hypothetical protein